MEDDGIQTPFDAFLNLDFSQSLGPDVGFVDLFGLFAFRALKRKGGSGGRENEFPDAFSEGRRDQIAGGQDIVLSLPDQVA